MHDETHVNVEHVIGRYYVGLIAESQGLYRVLEVVTKTGLYIEGSHCYGTVRLAAKAAKRVHRNPTPFLDF